MLATGIFGLMLILGKNKIYSHGLMNLVIN